MKIEVTAVFDIGKTNKKFFLFDKEFKEVHREYKYFEPIEDEDGYASENLLELQNWLKEVFDAIVEAKQFNITAINFSSYGASFVHIDDDGEVLTPLYDYTKPLDDKLVASFYDKYGPEKMFSKQTGSTNSGMLNSGMQLYWLKYTKPEIFKKIKYSLHLPQYISYIFTGIPVSEYTSIGCHTALWDHTKKDYHDWVYNEGIHKILPPLVSSETSINMNYNGKRIKIGIGIHDSSSALLPYVRSIKKKFVLVSTGTWSITFNPFTSGKLSEKDIAKGCVNYMRINSKPVKSSRLYLGAEYQIQVDRLTAHYKVTKDFHKQVKFDKTIYLNITKSLKKIFKWASFKVADMPLETTFPYDNFVEAYHQLMIELVLLQIDSIKTAIGKEKIGRIYVDGGFSDNNIYIKLLSYYLSDMKLRTTDSSLGSALGAAICISDSKLNSKFLKKNYSLKKHVPTILK